MNQKTKTALGLSIAGLLVGGGVAAAIFGWSRDIESSHILVSGRNEPFCFETANKYLAGLAAATGDGHFVVHQTTAQNNPSIPTIWNLKGSDSSPARSSIVYGGTPPHKTAWPRCVISVPTIAIERPMKLVGHIEVDGVHAVDGAYKTFSYAGASIKSTEVTLTIVPQGMADVREANRNSGTKFTWIAIVSILAGIFTFAAFVPDEWTTQKSA